MVNFGVQAPDFERVKNLLSHIPGAAEKAMSRAINKAINSAKAEAMRGIKGRYTISDAEIRKGIKVIPATANRLAARLVATSALHRVAKFKISKAGNLIQSEIVIGRNKTWPASFIAKLKSGHVGLFARERAYTVPTKGHWAGRRSSRNDTISGKGMPIKRQKIVEAMTLPTSTMMGYHEIIERTLELAERNLDAELDRQIGLFLRGEVK
jgi:hypothetical protein